MGQPRRARPRPFAVRGEQALPAAQRAGVWRAPVQHQPVHAAGVRRHPQSGSGLQRRVAPRVRADRRRRARARLALHTRSPGGDDGRHGVHLLLFSHAPWPRPPQPDLVFLDSAVVHRDRSVGGAARLVQARNLDGDPRPSGACGVVSGRPDCGGGSDLSRVAVCGRAEDAAGLPDPPPWIRRRACGLRARLAVRPLLLHPSQRASVVRRGGFRRSGRLVRAAREYVDGAMAPRTQREGAAMDLGRADGVSRLDHPRPRVGRSGCGDAQPRRAHAAREILHRARRGRGGAGARPVAGRGRVRIVRLVALRHTGARARAEPVQNSRSLHGAYEPCVGAARSDGLRGVASPLRYSRTRGDDRVDRAPAGRVLRRQVPGWRAAAFPGAAGLQVRRDPAAWCRPVAAGLREDGPLVPGGRLSVLLDRALASRRQRRRA